VLYSKLFDWLVYHINSKVNKGTNGNFIGVLDIFGFENFKVTPFLKFLISKNKQLNSFEQFCINFANEKLQQHFNQHIFKIEQEEYNREKINWSKIQFQDNQDCIELIEKRVGGILALLDEESKFPKATDETLLEKLHTTHEKHPNYEKPRRSKTTFIIKHYAGEVSYEIIGYLEKNRDTLQPELKEALSNSTNQFVSALFFESPEIQDDKKGTLKAKLTTGAQFKVT
jgi:myosin heavy subunit